MKELQDLEPDSLFEHHGVIYRVEEGVDEEGYIICTKIAFWSEGVIIITKMPYKERFISSCFVKPVRFTII
mgnify:CR=1 FL=1